MKLQSLLSLSSTFPDPSSWALVTMVATFRTFKLSQLRSFLFIQFEGLRLLVYTGFSHRKAGFPSWEGPWGSLESSPKNGRSGKEKAGGKEPIPNKPSLDPEGTYLENLQHQIKKGWQRQGQPLHSDVKPKAGRRLARITDYNHGSRLPPQPLPTLAFR